MSCLPTVKILARRILLFGIGLIITTHFSACSIAKAAENQSAAAKAEAVYAPIDRIGSTLDKWVQKYGSEYDFDVESGGTHPETFEPIVVLGFQIPDVEAVFGLLALSGKSELSWLTAKNREFLTSLELPFDISSIDYEAALGPPDSRDEFNGDSILGSLEYDYADTYQVCRESLCSDVVIVVSEGYVSGIAWQWDYGYER